MAIGGGGGGGGARAGDIRAGGVFFSIEGRDKLSPVLDKLQAKASKFGQFMSKLGKGALGIAGGGLLGGALGKIAGGAATGGAAGAALGGLSAASDFLMGGIADAAETARMAKNLQIDIVLMSKFRRVAEDFGVTVEEVMGDTTGRFSAAIDAARGIDADRARSALEFENKMRQATRDLQEAFLPLLAVITPCITKLAEFTRGVADLSDKLAKKGVVGGIEGVGLDFIAANDVTPLVALINAGIDSALNGKARALPPGLGGGATGVKGTFQTFGAMGQFGFGNQNSEVKKQTELLKRLIDGEGRLPDKIGDALADKLKMR
jgi:hypothetical protein